MDRLFLDFLALWVLVYLPLNYLRHRDEQRWLRDHCHPTPRARCRTGVPLCVCELRERCNSPA